MNATTSWNTGVFSVPPNMMRSSRVPVQTVVGSSTEGMTELTPGQLATQSLKQRAGSAQQAAQTFQEQRGQDVPDMSSYTMFAVGAVGIFLVLMYMRTK